MDQHVATMNVLPGLDNLKSIKTSTGVILNAQLTAPVTTFTLENSAGSRNENQFGNSTSFTIETDNNSTTRSHNLIIFDYNNGISIGATKESSKLYNLVIRGTMIMGDTSGNLDNNLNLYHIFVEGKVTNFDLYDGDTTIHGFSDCIGVNIVMIYNTTSGSEVMMNPSCEQSAGDITASSSTDGNMTSVIPEQMLECTNNNFCEVFWDCCSPFGYNPSG